MWAQRGMGAPVPEQPLLLGLVEEQTMMLMLLALAAVTSSSASRAVRRVARMWSAARRVSVG